MIIFYAKQRLKSLLSNLLSEKVLKKMKFLCRRDVRGSDSQVYYKKQFWRVLNISQEKTYIWAAFEIKLQACSLKLLFKKGLLYRCFPIKFSTFFAKYVRVTASVKYTFVCHINLSHQMLSLNLIFAFYFNYFQGKHFSFLNVLGTLAMHELIYCW